VIAVAFATPRQIDAQCTGVELLAEYQLLTTSTLYYPVGSSGSFVSCRCTGSGTPTWTYSNGTSLPSCGPYNAVCNRGEYLGRQNLTFSSFTQSLAGSYDCIGSVYSTSISIAILGQFSLS